MIEKAVDIAKERPMLSRKRAKKFYRMVAIITNKQNRILSIGLNSYVKTHPKQKYWLERIQCRHRLERVFLHAEMDAITSCDEIHNAHTIYIAGLNRLGNWITARPCEMICFQEIRWNTPIEYCVYTTNKGEVQKERVIRE